MDTTVSVSTHDFLESSTDASRFGIKELCYLLARYLERDDIKLVYDACIYAAEAHEGQTRMSGEAYIYHPIAVARILAELNMDAHTVTAAVLHDVIEDTDVTKEEIAEKFGDTVAELVEGVTKLEKFHFDTKEQAAAESFRKMMLAMVSDVRVILIKLADRLHNMRTLNVMRPEKRRRIARETLSIYSPIAMRLGINSLRLELEDLGFQAMTPLRYKALANYVSKSRQHRKELMTNVEVSFHARMEESGIEASVSAREKHLYSMYRKMKSKRLKAHEVMDLFAVRIVVKNIDDCYRMLGIAHSIFKPLPDRFKDYIAIPKANGYQSLHTILFGPGGIPIEVQIRTEEMHSFAESGIAAHWIYKSEDAPQARAQNRAQRWLQDILHMQRSAGDSIEFLENVKQDLFPVGVYVFTPQGKILELPEGSTAVDFAYNLHTDVGNTCIGAKIDRKIVPLATKLQSGQTIEIITDKNARPNPQWLNFVATAKARTGIRHCLKDLAQEDSIKLGRRLLSQALQYYNIDIDEVPEKTWEVIADEYDYESRDRLFRETGLGNRVPSLVARRIAPGEMQIEEETNTSGLPGALKLDIKGTEGLVVFYAKCCHPIPGDHIVAVINTGRGLVIHRKKCNNLPDASKRPSAVLDVAWDEGVNTMFTTAIRVDVINRRGILARVATVITDSGCDIEHVNFDDRDGTHSAIILDITVTDRTMLANVLRNVKREDGVVKASRVKG